MKANIIDMGDHWIDFTWGSPERIPKKSPTRTVALSSRMRRTLAASPPPEAIVVQQLMDLTGMDAQALLAAMKSNGKAIKAAFTPAAKPATKPAAKPPAGSAQPALRDHDLERALRRNFSAMYRGKQLDAAVARAMSERRR